MKIMEENFASMLPGYIMGLLIVILIAVPGFILEYLKSKFNFDDPSDQGDISDLDDEMPFPSDQEITDQLTKEVNREKYKNSL